MEAYLDPRLVPGAPKPWILSNPIDLYAPDTLAQREARASDVPPLDDPLPALIEPFDDFTGAPAPERWQLDRSPDARAAFEPQDGALRFERMWRYSFHAAPGRQRFAPNLARAQQ